MKKYRSPKVAGVPRKRPETASTKAETADGGKAGRSQHTLVVGFPHRGIDRRGGPEVVGVEDDLHRTPLQGCAVLAVASSYCQFLASRL